MRISDWSSDVCSSDLDRNCTASWSARTCDSGEGRSIGAPQPHRDVAACWSGLVAHRHSVATACPHVRLSSGWGGKPCGAGRHRPRSEEHTSELQSLMRISYAVFCLKKKNTTRNA